ncbi:MAG: CHASE2 domain-containing protein [Hyphomicrobiales bacterium]|nr:CHASE2 domain-containing protein [Hyphomicrobiales bacterium]MCP5372670.1 CHASE2 domain-containing protein [Hyphomicrobiales bacterium]
MEGDSQGAAAAAPWWRDGIRWTALAVLAALLALRAVDPAAVQTLRLKVFDALQAAAPRQAAEHRAVIVDIDERSIEALGQWPWPRNVFAAVVERLVAMGAAVVGFDVVFSEADRTSPALLARRLDNLDDATRARLAALGDHDAALADAIRGQPVVLGQVVRYGAARANGESPAKALIATTGDAAPFLPRFDNLVRNLPVLAEAATGLGMLTIYPEVDGLVRRVPAVIRAGDTLHPTLALEMIRLALGRKGMLVVVDEGRGLQGVAFGRQLVPTDTLGRIWVDFAPLDRSRYVSVIDLLEGRVPADFFRGRLVLIGASAAAILDLKTTPLNASVPGVDVHAQLIETILDGTHVGRPPFAAAIELSVLAVLGVLAIVVVPMVGARLALGVLLAALAALAGGAWYAFSAHHLLLDPAYAAAATVLVFVLVGYGGFRREERRRQWEEAARRGLAQYRTLVENIPGIVYRGDPGGERAMRFISRPVAEITGYPDSDFTGEDARGYATVIDPEHRDTVLAGMRDALDARAPYVMEYPIVTAAGERRWVHEKGQGEFDAEGAVQGIDGTIYDVTEQYEAREAIRIAHEQIRESVEYASRIQRSLLPAADALAALADDAFIIWEPRDQVGGDFYWVAAVGEDGPDGPGGPGGPGGPDGYVVLLADCTGHGVPGALMTTIAMTALGRALGETADPAELLATLNRQIKTALGQDGAAGLSDDGLELGICLVRPAAGTLRFAGARFSLFVAGPDGGEIEEVKGDRKGIGYREVPMDQTFSAQDLDLVPGQSFYMTSDGLIDQVGGPKLRGFGKKKFKAILTEAADQPMAERGRRLLDALAEHQGAAGRLDDVSVIGFRP